MGERARKLLEQALELPLDERANLAAELLASIDGKPDEDVEEAWAAEIERRVRELDAGRVKTEEWSAVRERIVKRLRAR